MNEDLQKLIEYNPTLDSLAIKFRKWHVESLLNQSADLLEKCLSELGSYISLDISWYQLNSELSAAEKEVDIDQSKIQDQLFLQRDANLLDLKKAYFKTTDKLANTPERILEEATLKKQRGWADEDEKEVSAKVNDREVRLKLKRSLTTPGNEFDLLTQRDEASRRFTQSYKDAYDRLTVASEGIKEIYGDLPILSFPERKPHIPNEEADKGKRIFPRCETHFLTDLVIWTRIAIESLIAYQQREQGFTRVFSVRSLLGEENWKKLEKEEMVLNFPEKEFIHKNVRMRGIAATIVGDAGKVPWSLILKVPQKARYVRDDRNYFIDQSTLPLCLLGRVENRQSSRPIEVAGLISLMNASPIGDNPQDEVTANWLIKLLKPVNNSENFPQINDLLIELYAVGVPASSF